MNPRGNRLACSLRTIDGSVGSFSAYPGEAPRTLKSVEPVQWDKEPQKEVAQATFSLIGDMGMTGTLILLNQYQWRALKEARLEEPFYAAVLWSGNPMKVVEDAAMMAKRKQS